MNKVGIIGGTGYTGSELSRLLCIHPEVELAALTSRQNAGKKVSDIQTFLKGYSDIVFTEKINAKDLDLVFVATPHGVAMDEVPSLVDSGVKVIDLSGDYRLHDAAKYNKWYGHVHKDTKNLKRSVYGLPELFRSKIKGADLVANPGCYATSIILACAPLVKAGVVENDIIADAKSGTSGAGMVPSPRLHHPFCGESIIPYNVGTHRHAPEVENAISLFSKVDTEVTMVPQLLQIVRGILSSCYMNLKKDMSDEEVAKIFNKQY
jgi:N-acetyl-gamma-glutamyl-phosphate reductase